MMGSEMHFSSCLPSPPSKQMSDNSDISVQWNTCLDAIASSPSDVNASLDSSLSPPVDIDEWDAFLSQVTSSPPEASATNPSPPAITSESEPQESSSEPQPSSTEHKYRPSEWDLFLAQVTSSPEAFKEIQLHLSLHCHLNHQILVLNLNHPPQRMITTLPWSQHLPYMFQLVTAHQMMGICKM